jgi:hypothetical protein
MAPTLRPTRRRSGPENTKGRPRPWQQKDGPRRVRFSLSLSAERLP